MSRESFSDFVHAVEHSLPLRQELKKCQDERQVINLANRYGFKINLIDIKDEEKLYEINNWFKNSTIRPLRRN